MNSSFLIVALKSTASQSEKLDTKSSVKLAVAETERAKLWRFRAWFSLTNHESNTQRPLEWPLTVPDNQKSTGQWLEVPPSQPCQEERQRTAVPATSENKTTVNYNLHGLSGFAARQERNLVSVHGPRMRIAH